MLKDIVKGFFLSVGVTLLVLFALIFSVALAGTDSLPEGAVKPIFLYIPIGVFIVVWTLACIGFKTDITKE